MSTPTVTPAWLRHSLVLSGRALRKSARDPGPAINGIVTPALLLVVFGYLFGGAVAGSTGQYLQYLFPGILVLGAGLTGLVATGTAVSLDRSRGVADRLASLPISRAAPLLGIVLADVLRCVVAVAALFAIGLALGFRPTGGLVATLAGCGLAVLFGFCLSWVTVLVGVAVATPNAVLAFSFLTFLPLQLGTTLAAPADTLPGWLGAWARVNPVSHAMDACRALFTGAPPGAAVANTLIWCVVLVGVFAPAAVLVHRRRP